MEHHVLVVSDDPVTSQTYASVLAPEFSVRITDRPADARELLRLEGPFHALVVDMKSDREEALAFVSELGRIAAKAICLLLTDREHLAEDLERAGPRRIFVMLKDSFEPDQLLDIMRSGLRPPPARDDARPGLGVLSAEEVAFLVREMPDSGVRRHEQDHAGDLLLGESADEDELLDELCCQPNPRLFELTLRQMLAQAERSNTLLAVLDIGLISGDGDRRPLTDEMIRKASRRLRIRLRRSDTILRLSGDELIIILWNVSKPEDVPFVARDILTTLSESLLPDSREVRRIEASIGVGIFPRDGQTAEALLKKADEAIFSIEIDNGHMLWFPNFE